jgi:hypothetical protein
VEAKVYRRQRFAAKYTPADVALLAQVDRAHERLSGRPRFSTSTTNGTTCDRVDSHTIPAVATNAMREQEAAIQRQFFARVMRSPYRSSLSRRAASWLDRDHIHRHRNVNPIVDVSAPLGI